MSQRISQTFTALKTSQKKALIPYISAGDPSPEKTVDIMHALVKGGADLVELGIPFSDPAADGETIQQANERALARGVNMMDVLQMVKVFREQDDKTPIILMGYLNSFERRGITTIFSEITQAGVDGVILVDCPIEALPDYQDILATANIAPILLLAPTTQEPRKSQILQATQGFIYYVSLRGVTGKQAASAADIQEAVLAVKARTSLPVCIGFGIKDADTARQMAAFADGTVIGSALVASLHQAAMNGDDVIQIAHDFIHNIRYALDNEEVVR